MDVIFLNNTVDFIVSLAVFCATFKHVKLVLKKCIQRGIFQCAFSVDDDVLKDDELLLDTQSGA